MAKKQRFGGTGLFPRGQLNKYDEGEIQFGIAHKDGNVILEFGKKVKWLGMGPALAREMAANLIKHADEIEEEQKRMN